MRTDELPNSVRDKLQRLCWTMNLPELDDYNSVEALITDVTTRVSQVKNLMKQATMKICELIEEDVEALK